MSKYTRRHYDDVARIIRTAKSETHNHNFVVIEELFSLLFEDDNPNFDPDRFFEACKEEIEQ